MHGWKHQPIHISICCIYKRSIAEWQLLEPRLIERNLKWIITMARALDTGVEHNISSAFEAFSYLNYFLRIFIGLIKWPKTISKYVKHTHILKYLIYVGIIGYNK